MIRVSTTVSIEDMSKAVRRAGAREIERRANRYGQQMVDQVDAVLQARGVNLNRPANRRRSDGPRVGGSWDYKVEGDPGSFPIFLTLTSSADPKVIEYLDKGTTAHQISARRRRGGKGYLRFPEGGAVDGPPWAYAKEVSHPGSTKARGFLRQVMSNVIGGARARAR
ncbi:MAG: hypothetical protein K0R44_40 [Thermomicrobiales bacterium]|nr:hypothetical protein [Thermomicrobiales bacterium]MDF3014815.1 hypothetical protein [Thermomicrobiales bacterium]